MKFRKEKETANDPKTFKTKETKKYTIRNRNLKKSFQRTLRPDLNDKITSIEDVNWVIMHGNNYALFKKMQRKKFVINKLLLVGVPIILSLIALSAITVSAVMFGMKYSSVGSFTTVSTAASLTSVSTTLVNSYLTVVNTTKSTTVLPVANYAY